MLIILMEISHQCDGDTLHLNLKSLRKPMHVLLSLLVCFLALWSWTLVKKHSVTFVFDGLGRFSGGLCNSPITFVASYMFLTFY